MVCANFARTTQHGAIEGKTQTRELTYYNLDVIISVGYRVKCCEQVKILVVRCFRIHDVMVVCRKFRRMGNGDTHAHALYYKIIINKIIKKADFYCVNQIFFVTLQPILEKYGLLGNV